MTEGCEENALYLILRCICVHIVRDVGNIILPCNLADFIMTLLGAICLIKYLDMMKSRSRPQNKCLCMCELKF